jgi:nucleotide-binding universal stress UspA family protein
MNVRRILVPTDLSIASSFALDEALRVASAFGARVTLMHVRELTLLSMDDETSSCDAEGQRAEELAREAFASEATRARASGVTVDRRWVVGVSAVCIADEAERGHHDLVVMGCHGRQGFSRLVLGSVTEAVVRLASCPVWAVPARLLDTRLLAAK